MSVHHFDPKQFDIVYAGHVFQGFAESFISARLTSPVFRMVMGIDGRATRIRNKLSAGTITITLLPSSSTNSFLTTALTIDRETGLGSLPFLAKDRGGYNFIMAPNAFIESMPELSYSTGVENRVWTLSTPNLIMYVGGLPLAGAITSDQLNALSPAISTAPVAAKAFNVELTLEAPGAPAPAPQAQITALGGGTF